MILQRVFSRLNRKCVYTEYFVPVFSAFHMKLRHHCFPCKLYLFIYKYYYKSAQTHQTSVSRVLLKSLWLLLLVRCRSVAPSTCLLHMSPHACRRQIYISYRTYARPIRRMRFRKFSQHVVKQNNPYITPYQTSDVHAACTYI